MCSRLNVDGLRGDLVINRAAKALVAYEGRDTVTQEDVGRVISPCLNHR
jgi:Mg-chelatase subunit ChlI